MPDVELRGADDVDALVRRIRTHADAKAIRKELYAGLNRATKGVREDMKANIGPSLPSRGGLAALVMAKVSLTSGAVAGRNAGVRIRARHRSYDLKRLNEGRLRHPVFGNRSVWVEQTAGVNPGFLDEAFDKNKPEVIRGVQRVLAEIARKVEG
ncbi:hypothetical protein L2K70_04720 [Nocardioides KLBMP 9356]|uniref:HK97 gp10 family phage protein n=1 Tax=Nocardioides potassii TaxID=2911371 RepID=A0ABS9HA58_9ACTN|nr:hypothetical protein [Nocardioides potassii]MCF6376898.1 hypothetical protein [Nocardioides potassii]